MENLILSLSIMMVAISNLITTITLNKRINALQTLVMSEREITHAIAKEFIKKKKENKHEI